MQAYKGQIRPVISTKTRKPQEEGKPDFYELKGLRPQESITRRELESRIPVKQITDQIIHRLLYIDRITFHISAEYIREIPGLSLPIHSKEEPGRFPLLHCTREGTTVKVHILARAFDPATNHEQQVRSILFDFFLAYGFIPWSKRSFLRGKELKNRVKTFTVHHFTDDQSMFDYWLSKGKLNSIEFSYILGPHSVQDIFRDEGIVQGADRKTGKPYECWYPIMPESSHWKGDGAAYDMSSKNSLDQPLLKWEARLHYNRIDQSMRLCDLVGTAEDLHYRFQQSIRVAMGRWRIKRGASKGIFNALFMSLFGQSRVESPKGKRTRGKSEKRTTFEKWVVKQDLEEKTDDLLKLYISQAGRTIGKRTVETVLAELRSAK